MVLLPVVEREMRVAARGRAMYRVRFYAVLVMVALFGWCVMAFGDTRNISINSSEVGLEILSSLCVWAFAFSLLIGVIATSDSVSHEKREGTLGLLFLTDLRGYDVICGKLAAHSVTALYALVATLPVLGIPLLMGGVTLAQFAKLALVLVTTLVFSLSAGIFVSTHSRNERKAMVFTLLLVLWAAFLFPLILVMGIEYISDMDGGKLLVYTFVLSFSMVAGIIVSTSRRLGRKAMIFTLLILLVPLLVLLLLLLLQIAIGYFAPQEDRPWPGMMFSPGYGFIQTLAPTGWPAGSFWFSVAWQWLVSALLIARACAHAPDSWEEEGPAPKPKSGILTRPFLSQIKTTPRRQWLDQNPFFWLAMRDEASGGRVWLFVGAIFTIWLIAILKYDMRLMVDGGLLLVTMAVLSVPLKIWIASEASRRFVDDRNNNTFEFLLSTPLTERQIILGQWLALWKQFAGPIAAVLAWEGCIAVYLHHHPSWQWNDSSSASYQWLTMFFLVLDSVSLGWVGMWMGLVCKGRTRAILCSLALVLGVPWVMGWIYFVFQAYVASSMGFSMDDSVPTAIRVCYGLLMNGVAIFWIRKHLPNDLRRLATASQASPANSQK